LLAYARGDAVTHARLRGETPTPGGLAGFEALERYAHSLSCRQQTLAHHFGEADAPVCGTCDVCATPEAVEDGLARSRAAHRERAEKQRDKARIAREVSLSDPDLEAIVRCVDALKKPIGRRLVVKALRGSRAKDVKQKGLCTNPAFGALATLPEEAIFAGIDRLLEARKLAPKGKKYPTLWIADKPVRAKRERAASQPKASGLELELKSFRRREAKRRRLKPYQVFQNRTLSEICALRPANEAELSRVWGMGNARIEQYGAHILELTRSAG
jgi:ATP-dependent DNA helicase RecQ